MRTTLTMLAPLFAAALASGAVAQKYLYSPPWLASTEGRSVASVLGAFADARYQFCDGDHYHEPVLMYTQLECCTIIAGVAATVRHHN